MRTQPTMTRAPGGSHIDQARRKAIMSPRRERILLLVSAHNGLSQRAWVALTDLGHEVAVAVVDSDAEMEAAVAQHEPGLIVCPFLKRMIPEAIWSRHRCLIVHPGPIGDRGPSSLDWAIELGARAWGVTVLEANGEFDAGRVWATRTFPMREVGKSSLYRREVRHAAIEALVEAIGLIAKGARPPHELQRRVVAGGAARPLMTQAVRAIDWRSDATEVVLRKIRAAEGHPGVLDDVRGFAFHLFGAHRERLLRGRPGEIIATRAGAICRATRDGAVWITHLKRENTPTQTHFKLPAARALSLAGIDLDVPEIEATIDAASADDHIYRDVSYHERAGVGYLRFDFYNGAMSTEQCRRLREAYVQARARSSTRVIVLLGGDDYFSNGIHLNVIEAAEDPAAESWRNLVAINDLVREIVQTDSHLVVSALAGDAAAGGVPLALAGDCVVAREDIVLNPYYQHMGGLYGSEYWTYSTPSAGRTPDRRPLDQPAVHASRRTTGGTDRALGRRGRHEPPRLPRPDPGAGRTACRRAGSAAAARTQAAATRTRRARKTARRLPHRRTRPLPRLLLRSRSELPRSPASVRLQTRPRRPGASGVTRGLRSNRARHPERPAHASTRTHSPAGSPPGTRIGGHRGRTVASGHPQLRAARDRMACARPDHRSSGRARRHRALRAEAGCSWRISSWRSITIAIPSGSRSHRNVEPSTSVSRNVTVPDGSGGCSASRPTFTASTSRTLAPRK